jgi:hypothetical protein
MTGRRPVPRTARHRLHAAVAAVAVLLGATACGSADEAPAPDGPVTYDVPGVPVSLTAPAGWERSAQDGAFVVRSTEGHGSPAVRPNVVVTAGTATTLADAGADTVAYVEDLAGWEHDADGQGPTTLGDAPAYRVSGTFEEGGALVAQEILLVGTAPQEGASVVHLTASYAPDDADGAAQAREALDSVRLTAQG